MHGTVTFTKTWTYEVEGNSEQNCIDKAYRLFKREAGNIYADEYETDLEDDEDDE